MDVNETKINIHSILTYQSNITKKKTWGKITIWPFRIPGPVDSMQVTYQIFVSMMCDNHSVTDSH